MLINQAQPFYDAARRVRVTARGTPQVSAWGRWRNWHGVNALEQISTALPTTATGYTAMWVGPINVANTGTPIPLIRTTGGGFRLEAFSTPGGAYIAATHTAVVGLNSPYPSGVSWDFRVDPWVVILSYDGTTATMEVRTPTGEVGVATTTAGMADGTGTLDLSASSGVFGAYLVGYARHQMPAGMRRQLLRNPWLVMEPQTHRVFFSVAGGAIDLILQNSEHAHAADNVVLTQAHQLATADATHGHAADGIALTQAHALATQDAAHAHAADAVSLTQAHNLSPDGATHAHTADNIVLALPGALSVEDIAHGHLADAVTLAQVHVLAVSDALHPHAVDALNLSGAVDLVVDAATHGHAVDAVTLAQVHELLVANNEHLHTAEGLTLAAGLTLAVADALHAHGIDSVSLGQVHALVVSDAVHAHLATHLGLSIPGGSQGPHTIVVRGQTRTIVVIARSRIIRVAPVTVQ